MKSLKAGAGSVCTSQRRAPRHGEVQGTVRSGAVAQSMTVCIKDLDVPDQWGEGPWVKGVYDSFILLQRQVLQGSGSSLPGGATLRGPRVFPSCSSGPGASLLQEIGALWGHAGLLEGRPYLVLTLSSDK